MRMNGEHRPNDSVRLPDLARALGDASPFDRAGWYDLLTAATAAQSRRFDAHGYAGTVSAWLPLVETSPQCYASLANWYSFSARPLFASDDGAPVERDSAAAALVVLTASLKRRAARLTLYPLPDRDHSAALLAGALRAAGWLVTATAAGDSHWLDLGEMDHDAWWATRPGALRSTIARKGRKGIVDLTVTDRFDAAIWDAYERVYAASWKPAEGDPALLRAFAEAEAARGHIRLGLATIAGEPVAAQFWTVEGGTAFIHKLAHVEDSIKASPGSLLSAALFRHVITVDGVRRVDFGTGNDPYKRDWMNRHNHLWRIEAFNPARPAAWLPAIKAKLRAMRAAPEQQGTTA